MLQRLFNCKLHVRCGVSGDPIWSSRLFLRALGPALQHPRTQVPSTQPTCVVDSVSGVALSPTGPLRSGRVPLPLTGARRAFTTAASDASAASAPDISDAQWNEVVERLNEMAASKLRPTVSGVRRNEFELMPQFMQRAGLTPERLAALNFIHVAGTKGKGSTCAMVESVLRRCGYRTGLYTSPHLVDVRERIRIDGQMLPRAEFAAAFWRVYGALQAAAAAEVGDARVGMPSFFYFITLVAMDAFLARPPHLAPHVVVLEVGIGGRLDATNAVVTRGSLAAGAITSLGFDHMELLGDTLPKIAREKAGIMKAGRPVMVAPQPEDAMAVLQEVASRIGAHLVMPPPLESYRLPPPPPATSHLAAPAAAAAGAAVAPATRGSPPASSEPPLPGLSLSLGLGGDHMRLNAALAVRLAAEVEGQYAAAARAAAEVARRGVVTAGTAADARSGGTTTTMMTTVVMEAVVMEAVEKAAGRRVALLPGGPDAEAAGRRAAAVRVARELPEAYVEGLRRVQWPGRSQVVPDEVAASRGGRVTVYLDGAHTPESMAVCAEWFRGRVAAAAAEGEGATERHATVLLFNCMKERDPAVLLPALGQALQRPAAAGPTPGHPPVDAAVFTPMLSSSGSLLPAPSPGPQPSGPQPSSSPPASATDTSWQARMLDVWASTFLTGDGLRSGSAAGTQPQHTGAAAAQDPGSGDWEAAGAGRLVGAVAEAAPSSSSSCPQGRLGGVLPAACVARSLPDALEAVRAAAAADPRVHVHVLVTGSLYLVGDMLRLLDKPPR